MKKRKISKKHRDKQNGITNLKRNNMKSINSLDITRLRVEEDFGFQKHIEFETALLTEETDKPMVDAFKAAVAAFDAALKASTRNSQSAPPYVPTNRRMLPGAD